MLFWRLFFIKTENIIPKQLPEFIKGCKTDKHHTYNSLAADLCNFIDGELFVHCISLECTRVFTRTSLNFQENVVFFAHSTLSLHSKPVKNHDTRHSEIHSKMSEKTHSSDSWVCNLVTISFRTVGDFNLITVTTRI